MLFDQKKTEGFDNLNPDENVFVFRFESTRYNGYLIFSEGTTIHDNMPGNDGKLMLFDIPVQIAYRNAITKFSLHSKFKKPLCRLILAEAYLAADITDPDLIEQPCNKPTTRESERVK